MIYNFLKRAADIFFSIILLLILIPIWIIIPVLIKTDSPGRVLFRQKRVGKGSSFFTIYKFRTMKEGTPDIPTDMLKNQENLNTGIGKILRRWSIDEFPQLINILKGEMSFIGPRPALYNQDELIEMRKQRGIDRIRPGVTGLAQVNGRDSLSIPEKVEYDWLYLKDMSLVLDLKILLVTIKAAITNRGGN
ncbi:MAG: sugar transferase [Actinobacteria bacterium]|nr:sugar transferase [Actinomycetota bacterium]